MNTEDQRIAIAKVCGLDRISPFRRATRKGKFDERGVRVMFCESHHGGESVWAEIPDYCNDLNAMHAAWSILPTLPPIGKEVSNEKIALRQLAMVVSRKYAPDWPDCDSYSIRAVLAIVGATSAQRAEAFLKALHLWID